MVTDVDGLRPSPHAGAGDGAAPRRRWPGGLLRALIITIVTLVATLVGALVVRAPRPDRTGANCKFDSEIGWVPAPRKDRPNPPVPFERTVGQRLDVVDPSREHVLMLGDSVTFGMGVGDDETASARLGKQLTSAQVLNLGVTGYSIDQYLLYLERELPKVHPKLIIVNIFTGNDYQGTVHDNNYGHVKPLYRLEGDELVRINPVLREPNCPEFLSESLAFSFLWRWATRRSAFGVEDVNWRREKVLTLVSKLCGSHQLLPNEGPPVIRRLLAEIDKVARGAGAKLLFVLLPRRNDQFPLSRDSSDSWVAPWPTLPFFQDLFRQLPYDVLDFKKTLETRFCNPDAGGPLDCSSAISAQYLDGAHLSVVGNQLLADTIYKYVRVQYALD
jgi:lysophospholipase L1-like esterase